MKDLKTHTNKAIDELLASNESQETINKVCERLEDALQIYYGETYKLVIDKMEVIDTELKIINKNLWEASFKEEKLARDYYDILVANKKADKRLEPLKSISLNYNTKDQVYIIWLKINDPLDGRYADMLKRMIQRLITDIKNTGKNETHKNHTL